MRPGNSGGRVPENGSEGEGLDQEKCDEVCNKSQKISFVVSAFFLVYKYACVSHI